MDELVMDNAYKAARKHNRRSEDMILFEYERYANIVSITNAMKMKSYTPGSNYSFIHRRGSKPREVFAAEPKLKIIMAFLMERIGPIIERHLSPCSYNNREGMGTMAAVNKVAEDIYICSHGYTRPAWIIKYDLKGYFPNIIQMRAYEQLKDLVLKEYHGPDKDYVLYALSTAIFCSPAHSYKKSPTWEWADIPDYKSIYKRPDGIGAMIGYHPWQVESSFYPVDIDNFITENVTPYYTRFVDDSVMVTDNKEITLSSMPTIRQMYAEKGITLHPYKFYCQPFQHGLEFLGYHILPGRIHINNRVVDRAKRAVHDTRKSPQEYVDSINSYLGIIKGTTDLHVASSLIDSVSMDGITKDYNNYKILIKSKQS